MHTMIGLHCSASSGRQWDAYSQLLPAGMRLIAPELMGYGPSERWPSGTPVDLEAEARRLAPLLFSAAGSVHLVGHSYGGAVALEMALRWPDRVKTLTLFEPVRFALLLADRDHEAIGQAIVSVGRRIGWHALSGRLEDAAALFVDYWSGPGAWDGLSGTRRRGDRRAHAQGAGGIRGAVCRHGACFGVQQARNARAPDHRQRFTAAGAQGG